jgi:hypothetical protein
VAHAAVVAEELGRHNSKAVVVSVLNEEGILIGSAED